MHIDHMTPPALAIAATVLHRHRVALDALRVRAEMEIGEYARAKFELGELIQNLIDRLDAEEGDPDFEGYTLADGSMVDLDIEIDVGSEPHDAADEGDNEPSLGWTAAEAAHGAVNGRGDDLEDEHDGREPEDWNDAEPTAPESYGRGWSADDARHAKREGLFSTPAVGIFASFKLGRLSYVQAQAREGRAGA